MTIEQVEQTVYVEKLISVCDWRERFILFMYFGIGIPRRMVEWEIAEVFGVSVVRINQIKRRAIRKIKHDTKGWVR